MSQPRKRSTKNRSLQSVVDQFDPARIVIMSGEISRKESQSIIKSVVELGAFSTEGILLKIYSEGGGVRESLTVYEKIRCSAAPVTGLVVGVAYSGGFTILQGCHRRLISAHSTVLVHATAFRPREINGYEKEQDCIKEIRRDIRRNQTFTKELEDLYLESSSLDRGQLRRLMKKNEYISAKVALQMGFVDEIVS